MTKTLNVNCGDRSYPIHIGRGLFADLKSYLPPSARTVVITDDVVAEHCLKTLCDNVQIAQQDCIIFPHGEQSKTLASCEHIYTALLERGITRDALIIALGGGVVGDMAGFVAATYLRGIPFVQIPTTLLAQVDSAVGGKTAVNHPLGKNMIGAFYQPQSVISDLNTLTTLPQREFASALSEIIKYGLILDAPLFDWIEEHIDALKAHDDETLSHAIYESCRVKAEVVAKDELELSGHRALLNLGHTFGHAIEVCLGYGQWLHGEAVGCGIVMAAKLSARLGHLAPSDAERIEQLIQQTGLPHRLPEGTSRTDILNAMSTDKKNLQGQKRFVLLKAIGNAYLDAQVSDEDVLAVIE